MIKWPAIAEEGAFIGGERFHHFSGERQGRRIAEPPRQRVQRHEPFALQDRREARLQHIGLFRGQHDSGTCFHEASEKLEGFRGHFFAPGNLKISRMRSAKASGGNCALTIPARETAPGMPQTTELASS